MNDDQFQILVSTTDFLKMQSRCHDLEQEMRKLVAQKDEIDLKLLEMSTRNADQTRKIIRLQESNKYLSLQGIKIAKTVLESSKNHLSIQQATSQAQTEMDYQQNCPSCSQLKKNAQNFGAELQKQKQRSKQQEKQFYDQYQAIKTKLQTALSKNNQIIQELANSHRKIAYLQKQSEDMLFKIEQLKSTNNKLSQKINNLHLGLKCLEEEKVKISDELDIYQHDRQNLLLEVSILNQSIKQSDQAKQAKNKQKFPEYVKASLLEEAQFQVNQRTIALEELNKQLVKLEQIVREKDSLIIFYGEQEKKQINLINQLSSEINRLKPKKISKADPQEEVRNKLDQYFTNFAFQLFDSGGIKSEDIEKTLKSQEEVLKKFIQDTVSSIASNLVKSKRNLFFNCMRTP